MLNYKREPYARYHSVDQLNILNLFLNFKIFNLLKFNDIYLLKLINIFNKLSNDSLPAYFALYKLLIIISADEIFGNI